MKNWVRKETFRYHDSVHLGVGGGKIGGEKTRFATITPFASASEEERLEEERVEAKRDVSLP
jgi:hypothetical protein